MIVWEADNVALEPSANVTTADPSLLTWTETAVGFEPLIASVTFEISSAVNADASATVVKLGAWTESDSFWVVELDSTDAEEFEVVTTGVAVVSAGAEYVEGFVPDVIVALSFSLAEVDTPFASLASASSALTDGAAITAPIASTREQPNRKCFPFLIIRQFFCSVFFLLKYI